MTNEKLNHNSLTDNEASLIQNWQQVKTQVEQTTLAVGRSEQSTRLIAVSKTKPADMIDSIAKQGQQDFGENYLQEAIEKIHLLKNNHYPKLTPPTITWHYIGHIQRNKTRDIAENFDWVHTIERDIIAKRLNDQRPAELPPLNVLIQVNIDNEESKSGCQPSEVEALVQQILNYPRLNLRGLMIIPATSTSDAFYRTQALFHHIQTTYPQIANWNSLSMGMSADMENAIEHGSTMVRVGTAIFGSRH